MSTYLKMQVLSAIGLGLYTAGAWGYHQYHLSATLPVTATIEKVSRECRFDGANGGSTRGPCARDDFTDQAFKDGKRVIDIDGTADVAFYYTAPQDGSFHTGSFHYGGRDDQFYLLKAGDPLPIRVAKDDSADYSEG